MRWRGVEVVLCCALTWFISGISSFLVWCTVWPECKFSTVLNRTSSVLLAKKSMPNGHVLIFLCVGDTTFGPVAEGARRQDVRSNEADVKSKRGDGPSRGSSGRKTKTGEDRATQVSWRGVVSGPPRSSSIRSKRAAWSCGLFWAVPHVGWDLEITCTSGNMTVVRVQKNNCTLEA